MGHKPVFAQDRWHPTVDAPRFVRTPKFQRPFFDTIAGVTNVREAYLNDGYSAMSQRRWGTERGQWQRRRAVVAAVLPCRHPNTNPCSSTRGGGCW